MIYKFDGLTIFLFLLTVLFFSVFFKDMFDSFLQPKREGFAQNIPGYPSPVESIYNGIYFDPNKDTVIDVEKNNTQIQRTGRIGPYIANASGNVESFSYNLENDKLLLYIPYDASSTFLHLINLGDTNTNLVSQYYNKNGVKVQKNYNARTKIIETRTNTAISLSDLNLNMDSENLETEVLQNNAGNTFFVAMHYLDCTVAVHFRKGPKNVVTEVNSVQFSHKGNVINGNNTPQTPVTGTIIETTTTPVTGNTITPITTPVTDNTITPISTPVTDNTITPISTPVTSTPVTGNVLPGNITFRYGDYSVDVPEANALSLMTTFGGVLGSQLGSIGSQLGSSMFLNQSDYKKDCVRLTEVVPGMGYDYYNYSNYPRGKQVGNTNVTTSGNTVTTTNTGSSNVTNSASGVANNAVSGATDVANTSLNLADRTVQGAYGVAKETVGGTVDLTKETVNSLGTFAKDSGSGVGNFLKDSGSGLSSFIQNSASGVGNYTKDAVTGTVGLAKDTVGGTVGLAKDTVGGTVGLAKDTVGGTVGLAKDTVGGVLGLTKDSLSGVGNYLQRHGNGNGNGYGGYSQGGYNQSGYGNQSQGGYNQGGYGNQNQRQGGPGMDPYSYYGTIPPRNSSNYMPLTSDFSKFGR